MKREVGHRSQYPVSGGGVGPLRWLLIVWWACCGGWVLADNDFRTWTSIHGAQVEARLDRVEGEWVVLEDAAGQQLEIRAQQLVPEDRAIIQQMAASAVEEDESGRRLPVFAEGPGEGYHAVFSRPTFDARVTERGFLELQPKDQGQAVGPVILVAGPRVQQGDPYELISTTNIESPSGPVLNPRELTVTGRTENNVTFEVTYSFEGDEVRVVAQITDPVQPSPQARLWMRSSVPALDTIKPEHNATERERLLRGHQLRYRTTGGSRRENVNFHASVSVHRRVDWVEINGPWGGRTVVFEADNRRDGNTFTLHNYRGRPLSDGFSFTRVVEAGSQPGRLTVRLQ